MPTPYPCFLSSDHPEHALHDALSAHWTVQADPACRVQRRYLDTDDSRLAAAGGALQFKRSGQVLGLVYEDLANGKPLASRRVTGVPDSADDIPHGVLRERLVPIVGDRPLHERLRVDARVQALRLLDGEVVVARLLVESGECRRAEGAPARPLATRLTLVPVAGQAAAGRSLHALLARQPGLAPCTGTRLAQALATLGRAAG